MRFTDTPQPQWHERWTTLATEAEGTTWHKLLGRWTKAKMEEEHNSTDGAAPAAQRPPAAAAPTGQNPLLISVELMLSRSGNEELRTAILIN